MFSRSDRPAPWEGLTPEQILERTTFCSTVTHRSTDSGGDSFRNLARLTELDEFLASVRHHEVEQHRDVRVLPGIELIDSNEDIFTD